MTLAGSANGDPDRRIYSESLYPRIHFSWSELASLSDSRYEYIEAPRPELYELQSDPGELRDLSGTRSDSFRSRRHELEAIVRILPPSSPAAGGTSDEVARLGSLGYVSARTHGSGPLPDPKDRVETLRKYKLVFRLFYERRDEETISLAREILAKDPAILSVSRMLASSLDRTGRAPEGSQELERALSREATGEITQDQVQGYEELTRLLEKTGDLAGNERVLRDAIRRGVESDVLKGRLAGILAGTGRSQEAASLLTPAFTSSDPEALELRGAALAALGRGSEARQLFLAALERDPRNANALFHMGVLALEGHDPVAARQWLERAIAVNPAAPAEFSYLGLAQSQVGDSSGALDSWRRAIDLDPNQHEALFNAAILSGKMGHTEDARRDLARFLARAPASRYARERVEAARLLRLLPSQRGTMSASGRRP